MTDLTQLLLERGIKKVIIIDDAYDDMPRPTDLVAGDWSSFFDDLSIKDEKLLVENYPGYEKASRSFLSSSQEFITILWNVRSEISSELREYVFGEYEHQIASERMKLDALAAKIRELGIECTSMGRDFDEIEAKKADIILIDLFLGFAQTNEDMQQAVDRVKRLVSGRENAPPLVILMSRSSRLKEKRNEFRDEAGLLGSVFRVVDKSELEQDGALNRIIYRLASHYEDAKRVAQFVHAWNTSLNDARERFIKIIRRLDLTDFAQVKGLLLEAEGQALGEYLLDICDGVIRHQIEANSGTIEAALALNQVNLEKYPAPHLSGTTDLQELLHCMVFQHPERLRLSQDGSDLHVQFGDIFRWKNTETDKFEEKVSLVITPACDLMRKGVDQILLLSGTLMPLDTSKWVKPDASQAKTPIIEISDEEKRYCIIWDLKNVQAFSPSDIRAWLGEPVKLKRIARLREMYAIEIQQKFLSDFGRVGQPANPPATFPASLSLFFVDEAGNARPLPLLEAPLEDCVCYVGRDKESKVKHRLVVTEQHCDAIEKAITALELERVHQLARPSLRSLKNDTAFLVNFERGKIEIPITNTVKKIQINHNNNYVQIGRNINWTDGMTITSSDQRRAALLIDVRDISDQVTTPPDIQGTE